MTAGRPPLRDSPAWRALQRHRDAVAHVHLRSLFADDPERGERLVAEGAGLYLDYAKQRVTAETMQLLLALATERGAGELLWAASRGERVNVTEDRAVLHTALRLPRGAVLEVDGRDVVTDVHETLDRMAAFCEAVHSGDWTGATGARLRTVVNIGIGGSHLGPAMAYDALRPVARDDVTVRFVSNVDPSDLDDSIRDLDPAETLFVVCSKTFTTQETMANAHSAREWLVEALGDDAVGRHFVAVSTNLDAVAAFGIAPSSAFGFWDWVGGRYSLMSAIGLSTMLAVGPRHFRDLLDGAHEMDVHAREAPHASNLPVLVGLLGVWNRMLGAQTAAVLPYDTRLRQLPAYLQQLVMESNGKRVTLGGADVDYDTAPVIWGEQGTNGQHSFFQLLHQGTTVVPCDLIVVCETPTERPGQHDLLVANALAQGEALAFGRTADDVAAAGISPALVPHRTVPGNRPSSTIVLDRLTPRTLGALISLYENAVAVEGAVWDVDSFDQWGVELGKELAQRIVPELQAMAEPGLRHDSSTNALIMRYRSCSRRAGDGR